MDDVAGAVQRSVEISLRRLRRDSVDVLHVHNRFTEGRGEVADSLSGDDVLGPVLDAYRSVRQAGKTRFIGLSAMDHHVPTMRRIIASNEYDTVLAYYNLLNRTAQDPPPPGADLFDNGQLIPQARSLNMGVIGIRSHAAGALTDALDRPPRPNDALMRKDLASAGKLGFLLQGKIRTLSQAAMVFSLMNPDIHTTVPGVKNRGGGRGNCRLRGSGTHHAGAPIQVAGTVRKRLPRLMVPSPKLWDGFPREISRRIGCCIPALRCPRVPGRLRLPATRRCSLPVPDYWAGLILQVATNLEYQRTELPSSYLMRGSHYSRFTSHYEMTHCGP